MTDHPFDVCCCLVERKPIVFDPQTGKRICHCRWCDRPREEHPS